MTRATFVPRPLAVGYWDYPATTFRSVHGHSSPDAWEVDDRLAGPGADGSDSTEARFPSAFLDFPKR